MQQTTTTTGKSTIIRIITVSYRLGGRVVMNRAGIIFRKYMCYNVWLQKREHLNGY